MANFIMQPAGCNIGRSDGVVDPRDDHRYAHNAAGNGPTQFKDNGLDRKGDAFIALTQLPLAYSTVSVRNMSIKIWIKASPRKIRMPAAPI